MTLFKTAGLPEWQPRLPWRLDSKQGRSEWHTHSQNEGRWWWAASSSSRGTYGSSSPFCRPYPRYCPLVLVLPHTHLLSSRCSLLLHLSAVSAHASLQSCPTISGTARGLLNPMVQAMAPTRCPFPTRPNPPSVTAVDHPPPPTLVLHRLASYPPLENAEVEVQAPVEEIAIAFDPSSCGPTAGRGNASIAKAKRCGSRHS